MKLNRGKVRNIPMNRFSPPMVCLIILIALLATSCGKEEETLTVSEVVRPVKMMKIASAEETLTRSFPGRVRASMRVELAFQVAGPLIELPAEEGHEVKKNALLARINPKDFKTNLRNAEGQLARAKAAVQRAQSEYDRILRIRKQDPGATSESMLDQRREAVDSAKADIKSFQAAVDGAKDQLSYTYLRAPFSGVISRRYVNNFQEVRAKQSIVSLDDVSQVEILIDVPELTMATIKTTGAGKGVAEFAAVPGKKYPVILKEYATRADPKTQTYQVVLQMPQPDDINVLPGMTATVTGSPSAAEREEDRFIIPAIAVFADESGVSHVWVVERETMKVQKRQVKTGDLTGEASIRILDGLKSGESIAVTGVAQLREGKQVRDLSELEGYKP